MKKLLFIFIALMPLILFSVNVNADANYVIKNNANLADWTTLVGNNPSLHLNNGETDGVFLSGESNDVLFDYNFNKEILRNEIMFDFYLDESNMVYENKPKVSFIFKNEKNIICSFNYEFLNEAYNVNVEFGTIKLEYAGMKYKDPGHIQFRIAKDEIMNRDTGEYQKAWNLVLGIQKKTVTTKNDSYSVKMNKFEDESFNDVDNYLEECSVSEYVNLEIKCSSEGINNVGLLISQIGTENFYNCYVYSNDLIEFSDINYTGLKMSYKIPENNANYSGFIIKRYYNGKYDKTYQYSNKYANSLTEKYLKQDSDYTYEIYALEQVSSSNRVACSKIMFRFEAATVRTIAGNPLRLVAGISIYLGLIALFIFIYVFRFDIKNWFKKLFLRK